MRMHPSPFPLTRRRLRAGWIAAWLVVALGVVVAAQSFAGTVLAQVPLADTAAANKAVAGNMPAYAALQEGRVDDAANLLRSALVANPSDGYAHQLLCRVFYTQEMADQAIQQCELAVSSPAPSNEQASDDQLWLGRAYGMKARHAGPIAGFGLARKVQACFARAVDLNPASVAAWNDLGEYDVSAPFVVGGGIDKAQALAARMMPRFPGAAYLLLGRIAEDSDDAKTAEFEFKQEVAVLKTPEAWIDLAQFYRAHKRTDEAVAAIKSAVAADRMHGPALVDAASILTEVHREPDLAERCLRDYLASNAKSDAAPAFKVHLRLSKLLTARGDPTGASRELEMAAALAPNFAGTTSAMRAVRGQG
jgi:tetratricopeptide (TPR) repeat protein